jgi:outer membrane protein assembly factor BamB
MRQLHSFSLLIALALGSLSATALDYYRWRGPDLNGISKESGWLAEWPANGPKVLWKSAVGKGFSSIAVADGRAFTIGNSDNHDTVFCFDAATGEVRWKHTYPSRLEAKYYEGGPGSTPTVDGRHVFTFGKMGDLFCLEAASGKVVWATNLVTGLGAKLPTWSFASSPVVEGDHLLLNVGATGIALDKRTGKAVWLSDASKPSGYSSAVFMGRGAERAMVLALEKDYGAVRVRDGQVLWRQPWKTSYEVNAADPIVEGDEVFVSSGYNFGSALLRPKDGAVEVRWQNKHLRAQFNPPVLIDGHIYGFDGDGGKPDSNLRCIEWATGAVKWTERTGFGALMAADGKLIAINEKGTLMIVAAKPDGFKQLASAQVLGGRCWTTPVLSHGRIYCRNAAGDLVCLDVKGR